MTYVGKCACGGAISLPVHPWGTICPGCYMYYTGAEAQALPKVEFNVKVVGNTR